MAFKVLVYRPLAAEAMQMLAGSGQSIEVVVAQKTDRASIMAALADCDAFLEDKAFHNRVDKEMIDAGKKLKLIVSPAIGYDTIDAAYAAEKGIWVANSAGASTVAVAEGTVMLMLGCHRNIQQVDLRFRRLKKDYPFFVFDDPTTRGIELQGKTLGLLGCGAIGRKVADIVSGGFSMRVVGYDPYLKTFPDNIKKLDTIEAVLAESDFVSLHLPSTEETRGSIGLARFKQMKQSAYFINAARGDIVREDELIEALKTGVIKGAGLDVYEEEPIKESSYALFGMDNVFMTPHTTAFTVEAASRYTTYPMENIIDVAQGRPPRRPVNAPQNPRAGGARP